MIDEVDKSSNNQLFLSFIAMLRDKYLRRDIGKDKTFHSVILASVYDVKNLKLKLRIDEERKYNSPWNIAVDFKEVQTSQEKRLDVVVTYLDKKYIVELKIWRGEKYHQKGLEQLVDYLDKQNVDKGYLLIFNFKQNKEYKWERINLDKKEIYAVWV